MHLLEGPIYFELRYCSSSAYFIAAKIPFKSWNLDMLEVASSSGGTPEEPQLSSYQA